MKTYITSISYLNESKKSRRELKIKLSSGATVRAVACYESWEQWGATYDELVVTMPTVESHNDWLHGGPRPNESFER